MNLHVRKLLQSNLDQSIDMVCFKVAEIIVHSFVVLQPGRNGEAAFSTTETSSTHSLPAMLRCAVAIIVYQYAAFGGQRSNGREGRLCDAMLPNLQVTQIYDAAEEPIPALLPLPGGTIRLSVFSLATLTGRRFLTPLSISEAQRTSSAAASGIAKRQKFSDITEDAAQNAAWQHLAAIFACNAPEQLRVQEMLQLTQTALLAMAESVHQAFGAYLRPFFDSATQDEVCSCAPLLTEEQK